MRVMWLHGHPSLFIHLNVQSPIIIIITIIMLHDPQTSAGVYDGLCGAESVSLMRASPGHHLCERLCHMVSNDGAPSDC